MNIHSSLLAKLRAAVREINQLIEAIETNNEPPSTQVGICAYCGQPILQGELVTREIHNDCYHAARSLVVQQKTTWEQLEKSKLVGSAKPGGRPRKHAIPPLVAENPANYIHAEQPPNSTPRGKRKT